MPQLFTIFGNPVSHSKSPLMHNLAFQGLEYDGVYTRYQLEDGSQLREKFFELDITGANITVPHKQHAFEGEVRCVAHQWFTKLAGNITLFRPVINTRVFDVFDIHRHLQDAAFFTCGCCCFRKRQSEQTFRVPTCIFT